MAVRLDQLPAPATRPAAPRLGVWLALLALLLLVGVAVMWRVSEQGDGVHASERWSMALGVPLLVWSALGCVRAMLFVMAHRVADGWDRAREAHRVQLLECGQRPLEVLAVSLHTALRAPHDINGAAQLADLLAGTVALKAQPCRSGALAVRHSRLGADDAKPETVLHKALEQVLADLAPALERLAPNTPLGVLLTFDSTLPEHTLQGAWQAAWQAAGIHQTPVVLTGSGLDALDQWLDQPRSSPSLWLVVVVRVAPQPLEGATEVVSGLLLGQRQLRTGLTPLACLHRPEQQRAVNAGALGQAVGQALEWASLSASHITQVWCAGVSVQQGAMITSVLSNNIAFEKAPRSVGQLDAQLGHAGHAAPWLALAAATQVIAQGGGPQFLFSGTASPDDGLWCMAVTPTVALDQSGI